MGRLKADFVMGKVQNTSRNVNFKLLPFLEVRGQFLLELWDKLVSAEVLQSAWIEQLYWPS